MSNILNIDDATNYVKTLVESIRCLNCDTTSGRRVRYTCGHFSCSDCAVDVTYCALCTPPSSSSVPRPDQPLDERVSHINQLLDTFQETFHVNVFRHKRISEKLKIEKELFPECIHANQTYYNKYKKTPKKVNRKKSQEVLPGELIHRPAMTEPKEYVKEWLEKCGNNLTRVPFSDLSVNSPVCENVSLQRKRVKSDVVKSRTFKTRSHFKTALSMNVTQSRLDKHLNVVKSNFNKSVNKKANSSNNSRNKEESGIVIDDNTIVIEDSQDSSTLVDKDHEAWLAVLAANETDCSHNKKAETKCLPTIEKKNTCTSSLNVFNWLDSEWNNEPENKVLKVPFYKKTVISEPCKNCEQFIKCKENIEQTDKVEHANNYKSITSNNVSIVMETSSLKTTINISHNENSNKSVNKTSKSVQTDITDIHKDTEENTLANETDQKLTEATKEIFREQPKRPKAQSIVISDSSDSENELSGVVNVTADVHHNKEDIPMVLAERTNTQTRRGRALKRGNTPDSNDSSDKENRDPNKRKRTRNDKTAKKKNLYRIL